MLRRLALLVFVLAPTAAVANPLESHCWCRFTKADAGACNLNATVHDAGAIGKFSNFQPKKNAMCAAACERVLADRAPAELCAGVARLGVPTPWSGALRTCSRVGARGDSAGASRSITCAAVPVAPALPQGYWRATFADEFKGMPAGAPRDEAQCYNRQPACVEMYKSGPQQCKGPVDTLQHLNKCTWTVLHGQNSWTPELGAFDTRQVEVRPNEDDGVLVLTTRAVRPDGTYLPFDARRTADGKLLSKEPYKKSSKWKHNGQYDCTRTEWNQASRVKCPFVSGALITQSFGAERAGPPVGFKQKYGRFEYRAKISYSASPGPSALWMLPQQGEWPGAGEIDIMEQDREGDEPFHTFHTGTCSQDQRPTLDAAACLARGGKQFHIMKSGSTKTRDLKGGDRTAFWKGYHTYAVEWDANTIRFLVDDVVRNEIRSGEIKQGSEMHQAAGKKAERKWMPMWVPQTEFYQILTQGPAHHNWKLFNLIPIHQQLNPDNFVPFEMKVDWFRAFAKCESLADFCPSGGAYDASRGQCSAPAGSYASVCHPKAYR